MSVVSVKYELNGDEEVKLPSSIDNEETRKLVPKLRRHQLTIHMKKVSKEIVNALRVTMIDELEGKILDVDKDDIDTDDTNIPWFAIKKTIQCIRLNQSTPLDTRFRIDVKNNTVDHIMIRASDIDTDHKLDIIPFNETFRIMTLRAGYYFKILNIKVVKAQPRHGNSLHSVVAGAGHKQLDIDPFNRGKGTSSLHSSPTEYQLNVETNGTVNTVWLLTETCKNIYHRLQPIGKEIQECKEFDVKIDGTKTKELKHTSDIVEVYQKIIVNEKKKIIKISHFKLNGEKDTIGNILRYFIYKKHPDIKLVNYEESHQSLDFCTINLNTENPKKIMLEAIDDAVAMFKSLEQQFEDKTPEYIEPRPDNYKNPKPKKEKKGKSKK